MGETRINLKHWLENERDAYPFALEEAIVIELVSNALDAGPTAIRLAVDRAKRTMIVVDDGSGMSRGELEGYHDIASTTKEKGKGIGWAGQGAKLALLAARKVYTETSRPGEEALATEWRLESPTRAPWDAVAPLGLVETNSGTAVRIYVGKEGLEKLLDSRFVLATVQRWFCPLLEKGFMPRILWSVYPKGVALSVNGRDVQLPQKPGMFDFLAGRNKPRPFDVALGRRGRPVGVGFLRKTSRDLDEDEQGLAVSAFGKVVKRGWEWTGISPRNPKRVWGMVEIPDLSALLTTNKVEFRKDASSLQTFYRYRKAIQAAIEPVLHDLGEMPAAPPARAHAPKTLERDLQQVLRQLLPEFPELEPLAGKRSLGVPSTLMVRDPSGPPVGGLQEEFTEVPAGAAASEDREGAEGNPGKPVGERLQPEDPPTEAGREHVGRPRLPGLLVEYEDEPERPELGWLEGARLCINSGHPAYKRVGGQAGLENFHTLSCVAWVLSSQLGEGRSPQDFVSSFWRAWGSREA